MGLVDRVNSGLATLRQRDSRFGFDDLAEWFSYGGVSYPVVQTTMGSVNEESVDTTTVGAIKGSSPVFALVLARMQAFSQVRFQWTRFVGSQPSDLFGSPELSVLERPAPGWTTSDLLARMEMHVSGAGNAYVHRPQRDRLGLLRPDRVTIVMGSRTDQDNPAEAPDVEVAGYLHTTSRGKVTFYRPDQIAHYAPYPDPDAVFLGMSWITPALREYQGDALATEHKTRFFANAAPQPLDAKVLTPTGWTTMGSLHVGDRVVGSDGKPHDVLGVYPQGERDIYRVTFSSGAQVECTDDHLWSVASAYDRKRAVTRTITLAEIMRGGVRYPSGPAKWSVPLVMPVEFDSPGDLLVDPYLLGSLLGDGCLRGNRNRSGPAELACHADDIDEQIRLLTPLVPAGNRLVRRLGKGSSARISFSGPQGTARICDVVGCTRPARARSLCVMHYQRADIPRGQGNRSNPLTELLKSLGLWGIRGHEKSIPEQYMRGSVTQRVALLQGLIDTDGSVDRRQPNTVGFDSTSETLCRQVAELVGTLGGIATVRSARAATETARPQWHVRISRLPDWINPCRLKRKAALYSPMLRGGAYRHIQRVDYAGRKQAQCIAVDSADHLYVTNDYVLTHNTPNLAIKFDASVSIENVRKFKEILEAEHQGTWNAFKTLYLGGGADTTTVGLSFKDMDYAIVQGRAESRLAADAGVPPSWVGFSEGLQGSALNAGNFTSARRRFSDGTMWHLWMNAATSLEVIVGQPRDRKGEVMQGASLWFDPRVPFTRDDASDRATIQQQEAETITKLVKEGFIYDSVIKAVTNNDWSLLKHSGWYSVQLQPPPDKQVPQTDGQPSPNGKPVGVNA